MLSNLFKLERLRSITSLSTKAFNLWKTYNRRFTQKSRPLSTYSSAIYDFLNFYTFKKRSNIYKPTRNTNKIVVDPSIFRTVFFLPVHGPAKNRLGKHSWIIKIYKKIHKTFSFRRACKETSQHQNIREIEKKRSVWCKFLTTIYSNIYSSQVNSHSSNPSK